MAIRAATIMMAGATNPAQISALPTSAGFYKSCHISKINAKGIASTRAETSTKHTCEQRYGDLQCRKRRYYSYFGRRDRFNRSEQSIW